MGKIVSQSSEIRQLARYEIRPVGLLLTIAVAFLLHSLRSQFAGPLLVYAAAVLFVMVHGPVPLRYLRIKPA